MKKMLLALFLLAGFTRLEAQQQDYDTVPPYKKNPHIPQFQLLQPDSTWFSSNAIPKNRPVVIMYFNPDCGHCQLEAKNIATHMDELKKAYFVLVSYHSPGAIDTFVHEYKLDQFTNIRYGRDTKYYIPSYFRVKFTPFLAVYNKKGLLQKTFETGAEPDELVSLLK